MVENGRVEGGGVSEEGTDGWWEGGGVRGGKGEERGKEE